MKRDSHIDKNSLLSRISGLQGFMVFFDKRHHLEKLAEIILKTEYETYKDENQIELDDPFVYRLRICLDQSTTASIVDQPKSMLTKQIVDLPRNQNPLMLMLRNKNQ